MGHVYCFPNMDSIILASISWRHAPGPIRVALLIRRQIERVMIITCLNERVKGVREEDSLGCGR